MSAIYREIGDPTVENATWNDDVGAATESGNDNVGVATESGNADVGAANVNESSDADMARETDFFRVTMKSETDNDANMRNEMEGHGERTVSVGKHCDAIFV